VALSSTIYQFDIDVANADRHVYESLELRVARHPSESEVFLLTRLLAYAIEYTDGIAFSRGLSEPDEPAISVRDLTGALRAWIEVGTPDGARLHRASKAAPRVAVYVHKDPVQYIRRLDSDHIHRAESIEMFAIDAILLGALAARLDRRVAFSLSVTDGELYVAIGSDTLIGAVTRLPFPSALAG
jgi:uncharacterized protein YaeQ